MQPCGSMPTSAASRSSRRPTPTMPTSPTCSASAPGMAAAGPTFPARAAAMSRSAMSPGNRRWTPAPTRCGCSCTSWAMGSVSTTRATTTATRPSTPTLTISTTAASTPTCRTGAGSTPALRSPISPHLVCTTSWPSRWSTGSTGRHAPPTRPTASTARPEAIRTISISIPRWASASGMGQATTRSIFRALPAPPCWICARAASARPESTPTTSPWPTARWSRTASAAAATTRSVATKWTTS